MSENMQPLLSARKNNSAGERRVSGKSRSPYERAGTRNGRVGSGAHGSGRRGADSSRRNYTAKILHGSIPPTPPTPLAHRLVLSSPSRHYTSSTNSIPLRFAASSVKLVQTSFQKLSKRHSSKIDRSWRPPNVIRRKRAAILAGSKAEDTQNVDELAMDEDHELQIDEDDVNFFIDEDENAASGSGTSCPAGTTETLNEVKLETVLEEAAGVGNEQESTIGYQAIKELRKDFEKAGLLAEKNTKKRKKSILQEDYKKILNKAGELIKYIRAIKSHPDRIHPELWYNEEKMANDGPLCRCLPDQRRGINHGIYPGEKTPPALDAASNNLDKLFHYRIAISPKTNFTFKARSAKLTLVRGTKFLNL